MKKNIHIKWKRILYMLCFLLLGIIDQRRNSASGEVQMIFTNGTGVVIALMIIPSLNLEKFKNKIYLWWTPICFVLTVTVCASGLKYHEYGGQWISGVLNLAVWSYLIIYIAREWKTLEVRKRLCQPFFWCIFLTWFLMQISEHEGILPLWYLMIFGGFYLIGIPQEVREDFFLGMLNGIIIWFFAQQTIAFGFRPYDYVRYRGMFSGETQSGLFYMVIYCSFLLKWLWAKEKGKSRLSVWFYFILSGGCISFMIFTGGRSALLGAGIVTIVIYTWYYIVLKKSFYRWMLHGTMLALCIALTFPLVYGGIRYLPAILHHPVWFEGEYIEGKSVCSFDPWDSPKYVSFEQAIENNVGRILDALGIDYHSFKEHKIGFLSGMRVYAAEADAESISADTMEPGSSPGNAFMIEGIDLDSATGARKVIYIYYWNHLNLVGHNTKDSGFYLTEALFMTHAHNMFLQMAYDYGIPTGILFLGLYIYSILQALWKRKPEKLICVTFLLAIGGFGMTEMVLIPGQITVALMWILFYFVGEDSKSIKIGRSDKSLPQFN